MYGAVIGDFVGSTREHVDIKGYTLDLTPPGSFFTDETVLMAATCQALLESQNTTSSDFAQQYRKFVKQYPDAGYGLIFKDWAASNSNLPTHSSGNGCATRVIPIALLAKNEDQLITLARESCLATHDHDDAIDHTCAVALAVYLAGQGRAPEDIQKRIKLEYFISCEFDLEYLHRKYSFSANCSDSVPQAIFCGLSANNYVDALRKGLYVGGDTDSILTIAGAIAQELVCKYQKIERIYDRFERYLNAAQRLIKNV